MSKLNLPASNLDPFVPLRLGVSYNFWLRRAIKQSLGQLDVGFGPFVIAVVMDEGLVGDGGFGEADAVVDHGLEDFAAVKLVKLLQDLSGVDGAGGVHRGQNTRKR